MTDFIFYWGFFTLVITPILAITNLVVDLIVARKMGMTLKEYRKYADELDELETMSSVE